MSNDMRTVSQRRIVTVIALDGRTEDDLLALAGAVPKLGRLDGLGEPGPAGVSGRLDGRAVAIGNADYFAALGLSVQCLCDWPDRIRTHGQQVLYIAVDGRTVGFLGIDSI